MTVTEPERAAAGEREPAGVGPFAWRRVGPAVLFAAAVLVSLIGRYGYHRDELYFLAASKHLAWGYDDQPPLTPALIRVETALFGDSVEAIRVLPTLFALGLVVLAALSAREFAGPDVGRSRRAQTIAAWSAAVPALVLFLGHLFVTANPNILCWALVLWLVARWLRTREDRLWLPIGLVAGVGLLNNNLVALLGLALLLALIGARRWDLLGRPLVWVGMLLALAIWTPNLVWQASHGWPQLTMAGAISSGDERVSLIPFQIETTLFVAPIGIAGWWRLARSPDTRDYRPLGLVYPIALVLVLLAGGKPHYVLGCYPLLLGAGAVAASDWLARAGARLARRRALLVTGIALTGVSTVLLTLPVLPIRHAGLTAPLNKENAETIGWPQLARTVAGVYDSLPAAERASAVLLAENYGEAGALARFGPALGLPTAYAAHDGYARFGRPSSDGPVIAVGFRPTRLSGLLSGCALAARIDNGVGVANQEQGRQIHVCAGPHPSWAALWPRLMHYS
jgi:4-amino-4-deoxy-L-arabinose transferase-like glycosyltransferase